MKNLFSRLAFTAGFLFSLPVLAFDITIKNTTDISATFGLPQISFCASNFSPPGKTRVIHERNLKLGCSKHKQDCLVNIYAQEFCDSPLVAQITLDVTKGITEVKNLGGDGYAVEIEGETVTFVKIPSGLFGWF